MTAADLITAINYALRGVDDDAPVFGDDDATYWLSFANRKISEWARDGKQKWTSLYAVRSAGTISAGTGTYALTGTLVTAADDVYVVTTGGQTVYFDIVKPQERRTDSQAVFISGNPQTVSFTQTVATDAQIVGGTLYVSGYWLPTELVDDEDEVLCDDPNWVAIATAADLAVNDIVYEDKVESLVSQANNLYSLMSQNNRAGSFRNPRRLQTAPSYRIGGPNTRRFRG